MISFDSQSQASHFRQMFSAAEDQLIRYYYDGVGVKQWKAIAQHLPGRTAKQCRDRYENYLDPMLTNQPWTAEEDSRLAKMAEEFGNRWVEIAKYFPGRAPNNLKNRWHKALHRDDGEDGTETSASRASSRGRGDPNACRVAKIVIPSDSDSERSAPAAEERVPAEASPEADQSEMMVITDSLQDTIDVGDFFAPSALDFDLD